MKKIFPLFISITISISLHGQSLEHLLAGNWRADRYIHGNDTISFTAFWDLYHFQPSGEFKMLQSQLHFNQEKDTIYHFLQSGTFREEDSVLKFSHVKEYEESDGYFLVEKNNRIALVNDTLLRFIIQLGDSGIYLVDYKRISEQEWEIAFGNISGVWWFQPEYNYYATDFHLQNSLDPGKRKTINGNHSLTYNFVRPVPLADSVDEKIQWIGMITALNDTVLSFRVYNETIEYYDKATDADITQTIDYSLGNAPVKTASINNAEIYYSPPGMETINSISTAVFSFSLVSGLIIAPLASIRYKQDGFNEKLYFNIAGYSMGSALLMVPVLFMTLEKTYHLTTRNGEKSKWNWLVVY